MKTDLGFKRTWLYLKRNTVLMFPSLARFSAADLKTFNTFMVVKRLTNLLLHNIPAKLFH